MKTNLYPGIKKEQIPALKFPNSDILQSANDRMNRSNELQRALILGNVFHNKVEIIFDDDQITHKVNTTIWSITEKFVILKGNTYLPIQRIREVKIL